MPHKKRVNYRHSRAMMEEDKVVRTIRACLLTEKHPISFRMLDDYYRSIVGTSIPYQRLGFTSLKDYLCSIPHAVNVGIDRNGDLRCSGRADSSTAHVAQLVHGQKTQKGGKKPIRNIHNGNRAISRFTSKSPKPLMYIPTKATLKIKGSESQNVFCKRILPKAIKPISEAQTPKPVAVETKIAEEPKEELMRLCQKHNLPTPEIKTKLIPVKIRGKIPQRFISKVKILNVLDVSTYPDEFTTEKEAETNACIKALPSLKEYLNSLQEAKSCTDISFYIPIIKEFVGSSQTGVIGSRIEAHFIDKYHQLLPNDWRFNLKEAGLKYQEIDKERFIIFPAVKNTNISDGYSSTPRLPEPLTLPSYENNWFVHVTYIVNSSNLGIVLVGESYNTKYEALMDAVTEYYSKSPVHAKAPQKGGLYMAKMVNDWLRVEITSVNDEDGKASCYFCDVGDEDDVNLEDLYVMPPEFAELPYQAIHCVLHDLEDYDLCESLTDLLLELALDKSLVAQVIKKENDRVHLVLFDTSTTEDININQVLLNKTKSMFPSLPNAGDVSYLYLTYIEENGTLHVQPNCDMYSVYERAISKAQPFAEKEAKGVDDVSNSEIYLAKYSLNNCWYRAIPVGPVVGTKVTMQFLDYGNKEEVQLQNICLIDNIYPNLKSIPKMSCQCQLANVPATSNLKFCDKTAQKLRELAPDDQPLLIKTITSNPYFVELFTRNENGLVSVNNELSKDLTLFSEVEFPNIKQSIPGLGRGRGKCEKPAMKMPGSQSTNNLDPNYITSQLSTPPLPSEIDYFEVVVVSPAHPGNFIVQPRETMLELKKLVDLMTTHYSSVTNASIKVIEGAYYAAFNKQDSCWYRIKVEKYVHDDAYSCHLVDYGKYAIICGKHIQYLLPNFRTLPYQAIKAELADIVPTHGDWTPEDTLRFSQLTEDKEFVSVVKKISSSEPVKLSVLLVDTHDETDIYIHDILIEENRAKRKSN